MRDLWFALEELLLQEDEKKQNKKQQQAFSLTDNAGAVLLVFYCHRSNLNSSSQTIYKSGVFGQTNMEKEKEMLKWKCHFRLNSGEKWEA